MLSVGLKTHINWFRSGLCPEPHWGSLHCSLISPVPYSW